MTKLLSKQWKLCCFFVFGGDWDEQCQHQLRRSSLRAISPKTVRIAGVWEHREVYRTRMLPAHNCCSSGQLFRSAVWHLLVAAQRPALQVLGVGGNLIRQMRGFCSYLHKFQLISEDVNHRLSKFGAETRMWKSKATLLAQERSSFDSTTSHPVHRTGTARPEPKRLLRP